MLDGIKRFFSRNRRKFVIVGVAVGGTYLAVRYAKQKLIEYQESSAREFLENRRRIQHFENTEKTCNQAILGLSTNVCEEILDILNTDIILEKLRTNAGDKLQMWEKLKIVAFTRLTTMIYATTILVVTLRVQLNLLGGYIYKSTRSDEDAITEEQRESYLSLLQSFLRTGLRELSKLIEAKVRMVLESYPLTKKLSLSDVEHVFWSIQMAVNSDPMEPIGHLVHYVFPAELDENNELFKKMYNETLDILESDDVAALCANNISRGFSIAVDNVAEYFTDTKAPSESMPNGKAALETHPSSSKVDDSVVNINSLELPLAKIIPILNGITSQNYESDSSKLNLFTSLVTFYSMAEKNKTLGVNVYEVFSV